SGIQLLDASAENISDPQNSYNGLSNVDPHYWLSIQNAKIITQTIADDLSLRFPEFAVEIAINKSNYLEELNKAEQEIIVMLNQVQNKNLLTLHNAWYYFADAYDLSIVGTFEPTAGREPTPQYLVQLMEAIEKSGSKTLYSEPQLATLSLESFLIDNDLSLSELDPIGGVSGRESYIKLMLYNANVISQNQ
ncbi:MAG: metal ABC transporter substrate-binding protein, partial [Candidatus Uhrbacteria bacterium]|nr:metal ABC transporter substrate-binding protein [Candidatus Uhrbacteria bacterium]